MRLWLFVLGAFAVIVCIASPASAPVCFSKRSGNFRSSQKKSQNKRSSKRLSCFYLAPYRNPPGPSDLGWRSSGATVCVCSGHGVGWAIASAPSQFIHRNPPRSSRMSSKVSRWRL